ARRASRCLGARRAPASHAPSRLSPPFLGRYRAPPRLSTDPTSGLELHHGRRKASERHGLPTSNKDNSSASGAFSERIPLLPGPAAPLDDHRGSETQHVLSDIPLQRLDAGTDVRSPQVHAERAQPLV